MSNVLSLDQFEKALSQFSGVYKYGWLPEFRKIGSHIRKQTRARFNLHMSPDGSPWPKREVYPEAPKIGKKSVIHRDAKSGDSKTYRGNRFITIDIKSQRSLKRALKTRKKFGPTLNKVPAIYRRSKPKATSIYDFLVKNAFGRSIRLSKYKMEYGYTKGTDWIRRLQFGGMYNGKSVPAREMLGLNGMDLIFIDKTISNGIEKRLDKILKG